MNLTQALTVVKGDVVAFVGAGGKTSAMIALGHELAEAGWRVLATTTTHIGADQLRLMPHAVTPDSANMLSSDLAEHRFVFLYDHVDGETVYGVSPDHLERLLDTLDSDVLLIEADNARGLPLKAPFPTEPVIPEAATLVVPVAGFSALGQPLDEAHIYNAQAMIDHFGFYEGQPVKSPWIAQVIRDDELGLRGVPDRARVVALINQTPSLGYYRARARMIARLILRSLRVQGVALGSVRAAEPILEVQRPIGAVVLAAGMSRRMGKPKLLLPWEGQRTIIEHIVQQLILARVDHIVVVTGHHAFEVGALAEHHGATPVFNPDYQISEMLSSVKVGLSAMPPNIAAAMLVLGDQPRIQPRIVAQVMTAYAEGKGDIVAPSYQRRRGHPILIDRRYWRELLALPEDAAPRDVINAHPERAAFVNVETDSVLRDIDTPQDYDDERRNAGLH